MLTKIRKPALVKRSSTTSVYKVNPTPRQRLERMLEVLLVGSAILVMATGLLYLTQGIDMQYFAK